MKFNEFDNALNYLSEMREDEVSLANAKNDQISFKSNLGEIKKDPKSKSKEQKNTLYNIEIHCKARNDVVISFMIILQC